MKLSGRTLKDQLSQTLNRKKSLIFKYGRIQKRIPPQLVCGFHGACLDCMLPGVQVTAGLGFFSVFKSFIVIGKIVTPCFTAQPSLQVPSGIVYYEIGKNKIYKISIIKFTKGCSCWISELHQHVENVQYKCKAYVCISQSKTAEHSD